MVLLVISLGSLKQPYAYDPYLAWDKNMAIMM